MNFLKNEIYAVKNDCISYSIYHESGGKEVQLDKDEKYVMRIKKNLSDPEALEFISNTSDMCFDCPLLECGEYYFEISTEDATGKRTVIAPAADEYGNCLNRLVIIERL